MYFGITTIAWSIMTWREASLYSPPVGDHRGSRKAKTACPAQARPSRNLLSLRPHPPTLAIIPANPPTLCPPPFKSLCQIREVMYRLNTYILLMLYPAPFCHALCFPSIRLCLLVNKEAKIKALVLVSYPQKPIWIVSSVIGHFGSLTMLSEYYKYIRRCFFEYKMDSELLQVFYSNQRNTIRHLYTVGKKALFYCFFKD